MEKEMRYLESVVRFAVGKYGHDAMREMQENADYLGKMMQEYNVAYERFLNEVFKDDRKKRAVAKYLGEAVYNELNK